MFNKNLALFLCLIMYSFVIVKAMDQPLISDDIIHSENISSSLVLADHKNACCVRCSDGEAYIDRSLITKKEFNFLENYQSSTGLEINIDFLFLEHFKIFINYLDAVRNRQPISDNPEHWVIILEVTESLYLASSHAEELCEYICSALTIEKLEYFSKQLKARINNLAILDCIKKVVCKKIPASLIDLSNIEFLYRNCALSSTNTQFTFWLTFALISNLSCQLDLEAFLASPYYPKQSASKFNDANIKAIIKTIIFNPNIAKLVTFNVAKNDQEIATITLSLALIKGSPTLQELISEGLLQDSCSELAIGGGITFNEINSIELLLDKIPEVDDEVNREQFYKYIDDDLNLNMAQVERLIKVAHYLDLTKLHFCLIRRKGSIKIIFSDESFLYVHENITNELPVIFKFYQNADGQESQELKTLRAEEELGITRDQLYDALQLLIFPEKDFAREYRKKADGEGIEQVLNGLRNLLKHLIFLDKYGNYNTINLLTCYITRVR